jgi:diguanylate cyclase (GGDEF)-like protein
LNENIGLGEKAMKLEEEKVYGAFKQKFFHWFLTYNDYENFSNVITELLLLLKQELMMKQATFFVFDPLNKVFYPEATTKSEESHSPFCYPVLSDDIAAMMDDEQQTIQIHEEEKYTTAQIFLRFSEESIGMLQLVYDRRLFVSRKLLKQIKQDFLVLFQKFRMISQGLSDEKRYEQLHRFAAKIHSSMKIDDVLKEIINTLKQVYPSFTYHLFLSHDNYHCEYLPIKTLVFDESGENMAAMQAFLTGRIQLEDSVSLHRSILYAPIKGAQGVYGVIEIMAPYIMEFPKREINFISLLANTAGSALENAKLYEQSRRLIADLQLINETMHQLNSNLRLQDAIEFIVKQIKQSFGADEVGFFWFEGRKRKLLPGSTPFFQSRSSKKYIEFVEKKMKTEKDIVFVGDAKVHASFSESVYRSLMAAPMAQNGELKGVSIVLHREPYHFTFEMFKLLQSLIQHSTLAFTNSMLREELETLVVTDYLTKLYTRRYLDEQIKKSMIHDAFGTFILVDIDNFKQVNDTYGHQIGDDVLVQVANIIRANIRASDIGARWGGEELAVYLPKVSLAEGISIARRLAEKVREETHPPVTISCGISYWKKNRLEEAKELFKRADEALYMAKRTGKNCIFVKDYVHQYKV